MNRITRINAELRKQLALILQGGIKDPRVKGLISVSKVDCDPDLTLAKVYVSILGAQGEEQSVIEGLTHAEGYIKARLKDNIKLRAMPQLRFIYDDSYEYQMKIEKLIREVHEDEQRGKEE